MRLLSFLKANLEGFSTQDLRWSVEHHRCWVNGSVERFCSYQVKSSDQVTVYPIKKPRFVRDESSVLFEDDSLLFYRKPAGISSTDFAKLLGVLLAHRLDRDTTGVICFAKDKRVQKGLEDLFRKRTVKKTYLALVKKGIQTEGTFKGKMAILGRREGSVRWGMRPDGVNSETTWKVIEKRDLGTLIECYPKTGRTHQIRVHMKALGHPIIGDVEYGDKKVPFGIFRPLLHALKIEFVHPITGELLSVTCPELEDFSPMEYDRYTLNLKKGQTDAIDRS